MLMGDRPLAVNLTQSHGHTKLCDSFPAFLGSRALHQGRYKRHIVARRDVHRGVARSQRNTMSILRRREELRETPARAGNGVLEAVIVFATQTNKGSSIV